MLVRFSCALELWTIDQVGHKKRLSILKVHKYCTPIFMDHGPNWSMANYCMLASGPWSMKKMGICIYWAWSMAEQLIKQIRTKIFGPWSTWKAQASIEQKGCEKWLIVACVSFWSMVHEENGDMHLWTMVHGRAIHSANKDKTLGLWSTWKSQTSIEQKSGKNNDLWMFCSSWSCSCAVHFPGNLFGPWSN